METIAKRQRETYISTLNHDLKIPAIAQIRALELLLDESTGSVNSLQKEIISSTLNSCRYMYEMLSNLSTAYKYENKEIVLNTKKTELLEVMEGCFASEKNLLENKNIKIVFRSREKTVNIYADKKQLQKSFKSIINHCISSAYKNTDIICEIKKSRNNANVFISFVFESPYIRAEKLERMFDMYSTPSEKTDKVGSGLALYLAKQIINAHNGNISVKTSEKNYRAYNIKLPCIL